MPKSKIELLKSLTLTDFPSGSSINYRHEKLYLMGDDSNNILILDKDYQKLDSKQLFDYPESRIPKLLKADLEASAIVTLNGHDHLLIMGSASTKQREKVFILPFSESGLDVPHFRVINAEVFSNRIRANGMDPLNLEGVTVFGRNLILSNRGNRINNTNHLIITENDFWDRQGDASLTIIPLQIPTVNDEVPGVSELCHVEANDTLLITFSSELTDNAYDDGAIGDSYIGLIDNFSRKLQNHPLMVDQIINLSDIHGDFKNVKIEGICVEQAKRNALILHLISDNDQGESKLFKVKMINHA